MKKRIYIIFGVCIALMGLNGCARSNPGNGTDHRMQEDAALQETDHGDASGREEQALDPDKVPQLEKVKSICELTTLKCYYHNVAKGTKESGTGLVHLGEKERTFWMEYTGEVEISFRSELIRMEQDGANITITLPEPQITCTVNPDSWNTSSYVISKDNWFQQNPITADDQTKAIDDAQKKMEEDTRNNTALLETARMQAKEIIETYINQIGEMTGVQYEIFWNEESAREEVGAS